MQLSRRIFSAAFLALSLVFAQGAGAAHTLLHSMAEQQNKQLPSQPDNCAQCLSYANLGNTLNSPLQPLQLFAAEHETLPSFTRTFVSRSTLQPSARGPPAHS